MLVGTWEGVSRADLTDSGGTLVVHTTVEADRQLGGRFVVARSAVSFEAADGRAPPPPSESVTWFTWDEGEGEYRYWTFPSGGPVSSGTMAYDPRTNVWSLQELTWDASRGRWATTGRGTMEYLSDSEKIVRWHSRPLVGGGFDSEGRSRRIREH